MKIKLIKIENKGVLTLSLKCTSFGISQPKINSSIQKPMLLKISNLQTFCYPLQKHQNVHFVDNFFYSFKTELTKKQTTEIIKKAPRENDICKYNDLIYLYAFVGEEIKIKGNNHSLFGKSKKDYSILKIVDFRKNEKKQCRHYIFLFKLFNI